MMRVGVVRSIMFISSYFPLYVLLLVSQGNKMIQATGWHLGVFIGTLSILILISFISVIL